MAGKCNLLNEAFLSLFPDDSRLPGKGTSPLPLSPYQGLSCAYSNCLSDWSLFFILTKMPTSNDHVSSITEIMPSPR